MKKKAYYILIGLILFLIQYSYTQNKKIADSLQIIYETRTLQNAEKLELLRNLSFHAANELDLSLKYANELILLAQKEENYLYLYRGYSQKGQTYRIAGELKLALEAFFKSSEAAGKVKNSTYEGGAYLTIADVYSEIGNSNNAEAYYSKSISILRETNDSLTLASALLNAGDEAFKVKKFDEALQKFEESGNIYKQVNYLIGSAYNLGNIGMVFAEKGENILAEKNINEAIAILEELQDYYPISVYLTYMADIYLDKKELKIALDYSHRSLDLAQEYRLKDQISEAHLKLSELYEIVGEFVKSYSHYKNHIAYRDSVINLKNVQHIADLRTNYEVSQKQIEVDLLDQRRKNQRSIAIATAVALVLIGILAVGLYRRNNFIRKTKQIIEAERDRSDTLLLNILPEETASELKQNGSVKAKKYDSVTVLFTDFKGFTNYSEKLSPEALVETIGFYFSKFDAIIEKHGLEKIKTIGDAYMCAGGLHTNENDHAQRMVQAAFEIVNFVEETKNDGAASELTFDIRIGINTGPVVAGVVGTKKFAYDIWGDTVNVASRMESMSEPGKINIGESTYHFVKDHYTCEYRGEIEAKNRGAMKMYFVLPHKMVS